MITVAIDGPAASGKGTLARALAAHFNLAYLDTGGLYRAVALLYLEQNRSAQLGDKPFDEAQSEIILNIAQALTAGQVEGCLADPRLRSEDTGALASRIAALQEVREALLGFQRDFANSPPNGKAGAILDGRDIGTVVLPMATIKLYITADAEVRAQRRYEELLARFGSANYQTCRDEIHNRDARDSSRTHAPLKAADDAIWLDTSQLSAEDAFDSAAMTLKAAFGKL